MRWLLGLAAVIFVALTGGWFGARHVVETQAEALIAREAAAGRHLELGAFEVAGFPYRFDLSASAPRYEDPAQDLAWSGSAARLHAMVWKPWHLIAELPTQQSLRLGRLDAELSAESLAASLRAKPATSLPLAEARLQGTNLSLTRPRALTLTDLLLALRETPAAVTPSYDLTLDLKGLTDPALVAALASVDESGLATPDLPEQIDTLRFDATVALTAPLDRFVGESKPQLEALDIKRLQLAWGTLDISAQGQIQPDPKGQASGRIDLAVRGSEHLPALMVAAGVTDPKAVRLFASLLKGMAGEDGVAKLPLLFKDGMMSFGPFPLGPAPRLR